MKIFSVGHSRHEWPAFLALLQSHAISDLVDVRSFPSSRRWPHFNRKTLRTGLEASGIRYHHLKGLGGYRRSGLENSPNRGWKSPGFRNYADHMLSDAFAEELERLLAIASRGRTAVMCAEATPYRCHRQLICDALVGLRQVAVYHILQDGRLQAHRLANFARVLPDRIVYPEAQADLFE